MFKSRQLVNFKGKDCISDVRYNLAGTDGLLDAWIIPISEEFIAPLLFVEFIAFIEYLSMSTQNVVSGRHLSHGRSWQASWRLV